MTGGCSNKVHRRVVVELRILSVHLTTLPTSTTTMALPVPEGGKFLSEALNTVKIQVQQMKRNGIIALLLEPARRIRAALGLS